MKIVFFGSDDFAATNLEALLKTKHSVLACVTQPDRSKGRGLKVILSPTKIIAQKSNIPILQPDNVRKSDFCDQLKALDADLFIVIAYGKILPKEILDIPKRYAINVHASLLPKYRGAAPLNWSLINGDKKTGLSIIKLNTEMDAGDILIQESIKIEARDTSVNLRSRCADLSARCLVKCLDTIEKKKEVFTKQNKADVTLAPKLTKQIGLIVWDQPAEKIHNLVRGLQPWPTAYTILNKKLLKILETEVVSMCEKPGQSGEIIGVSKRGITVQTGNNAVLIKNVHPESSKRMSAFQFATGHKVDVGSCFGS